MTTEYPIDYSDQVRNYTFVFALENQAPLVEMNATGGTQVYPYISYKIYRKDLKELMWAWQGVLTPEPDKNKFRIIYEDGVNIQGYIRLFHSPGSGNNYVFMDAYLGKNYEEHFEGNVMMINNM